MVKRFMGKQSLIAVACALLGPAFVAADTLENLNLPAGELATALKMLADQADLNLVYQPEQIKDLRTAGLKGKYSGREAVEELLKGTRAPCRFRLTMNDCNCAFSWIEPRWKSSAIAARRMACLSAAIQAAMLHWR